MNDIDYVKQELFKLHLEFAAMEAEIKQLKLIFSIISVLVVGGAGSLVGIQGWVN